MKRIKLKEVNLTHYLSGDLGWTSQGMGAPKAMLENKDSKLYYIGKCIIDGDMFMIRDMGTILIYKGELL